MTEGEQLKEESQVKEIDLTPEPKNNITEKNGLDLELDISEEEINDGGYFNLKLLFKHKEKGLKSGDFIEISWENQPDLYINPFTTNLVLEIKGKNVGYVKADTTSVKIIFNEKIEDLEDINGYVELTFNGRNLKDTNIEDTRSIKVNVGSKISNKISIKKTESGESSAYYYKTGDIQTNEPDKVRWFINIMPNSDTKDYENIVIVDTIHNIKDHDYIKDSLEITSGGVKFEGWLKSNKVDGENRILTFKVPNEYASQEISIYYETKINNSSAENFINKADLKALRPDGKEHEEASSMTVKNISFGAGITGVKKGTIRIIKVDSEDNTKKLEGVEFELLDTNNVAIKSGTTENGGRLDFSGLSSGKYFIRETKPLEGYEGLSEEIEVTLGETEGEEIQIENKRIIIPETNLKIIKIDATTKARLAGAKFSLQDAMVNVVKENDEKIIYTTDENGEILIENIEPGKYWIIEEEAPVGYLKRDTAKLVSLEEGETKEVSIENEKDNREGSLKIVKIDSLDHTRLAGAEFIVRDNLANDVINTKTGRPVFVTDENGEIYIENLPLGTYIVEETKAPDGYDKKLGFTKVVISDDSERIVLIKNDKSQEKLGTVKIVKLDKDTGLPLPGAVFRILNEKDEVIQIKGQSEFETAGNGVVEIKEIPLGSYKLEEFKAPKGYKKLSETFDFIVRDESEMYIHIENEKIEPKPEPTPEPAPVEPSEPEEPGLLDPIVPDEPSVVEPEEDDDTGVLGEQNKDEEDEDEDQKPIIIVPEDKEDEEKPNEIVLGKVDNNNNNSNTPNISNTSTAPMTGDKGVLAYSLLALLSLVAVVFARKKEVVK